MKSSNDDLIISIDEAREILGHSYDVHSDEYIERLIRNLDSIAIAFINSVQK